MVQGILPAKGIITQLLLASVADMDFAASGVLVAPDQVILLPAASTQAAGCHSSPPTTDKPKLARQPVDADQVLFESFDTKINPADWALNRHVW